MQRVRVTNMTNLFRREILIYSFFDFQLRQPLQVMRLAYLVLLFVLFGVPLLLIKISSVTIFTAVAGPVALSSVMVKPIWGGKTFFDFLKTQIKFIFSPKRYYDTSEGGKMETYEVNQQIIVSRHKDFNKLYEIERKERADVYE